MLSPKDQQKLLWLAAGKAIRSSNQAHGQCLMMSLQLAHSARDIEGLSLLRWRVKNDPDFHEHWALRLSGDDAIDPTRVQVDGKRAVVKSIASYPATYFLAGEYPLEIFLTNPDAGAQQLRMHKKPVPMRWSMHRHDVAVATGVNKAAVLFTGLVRFTHFLANFCIGELRRGMQSRQEKLCKKLDNPDGAVKKTPGKPHPASRR